MDDWIRTNPGKNLFGPPLFKGAQAIAGTPQNIVPEFSSAGNWPYNPQLFDKTDFAPTFFTECVIIQDSGSS